MKSPSRSYSRAQEAREVIETYPSPMREHCLGFTDHKVHAVNGELLFEATVSAHDIRDTFMRFTDTGWDKFAKTSGLNTSDLKQHASGSADTSFYGMTGEAFVKELRGETRVIQRRFENAVEELEKTGLKQALEEGAAFKKKRKRTMSEHDGDYDMERKWDTHPFATTVLSKKEFPIVELIFPIVNSGGTGHSSISRFGARCLALADLLEKAGYRVALTAENWCTTMRPTQSDLDRLAKPLGIDNPTCMGQGTRYIIRSANDYGDISSMALFGSGEFYRRCAFSLDYEPSHYAHALGKESRDKNVPVSYGYPHYERPIPTEPGQIFLTSQLMSQLFTSSGVEAQEMFQERIMWQLRVEQATGQAS